MCAATQPVGLSMGASSCCSGCSGCCSSGMTPPQPNQICLDATLVTPDPAAQSNLNTGTSVGTSAGPSAGTSVRTSVRTSPAEGGGGHGDRGPAHGEAGLEVGV